MTFSPRINYNSSVIENRKFLKIEDKLRRDGEILKEKKAMEKLKKNIEEREQIEKNKIKCHSTAKKKKERLENTEENKIIVPKETLKIDVIENNNIINSPQSSQKPKSRYLFNIR